MTVILAICAATTALAAGPAVQPRGPPLLPPPGGAPLAGQPVQLGGGAGRPVSAMAIRPWRELGPAVGGGPSTITVVVLEAPMGDRIQATLDGVPLILDDPGEHFLLGSFLGPAKRFVQLDLSLVTGKLPLYRGLVAVADQHEAVLAFALVTENGRAVAVRAPVSLSAAVDLGADSGQAGMVKWGWAALSLLWVAAMVIARARRA